MAGWPTATTAVHSNRAVSIRVLRYYLFYLFFLHFSRRSKLVMSMK
jgi:hypothetical protein